MASTLEFRQEAVSQAEKDFSKLHLSPEQKQGIAGFAQLYAKFLPMSELAIKGFIAMTMRDFQVQEKIDAAAIQQFPREKREMYVKKMSKILQEKLEKVLRHPEQKIALQEAVRKAYEFAAKVMSENPR
jgi:hypothetical protein